MVVSATSYINSNGSVGKLPFIKSYNNGKTLESLQWGLTPSWAKEREIKPLINARLETLNKKISLIVLSLLKISLHSYIVLYYMYVLISEVIAKQNKSFAVLSMCCFSC